MEVHQEQDQGIRLPDSGWYTGGWNDQGARTEHVVLQFFVPLLVMVAGKVSSEAHPYSRCQLSRSKAILLVAIA